jgi:hypothetical protein
VKVRGILHERNPGPWPLMRSEDLIPLGTGGGSFPRRHPSAKRVSVWWQGSLSLLLVSHPLYEVGYMLKMFQHPNTCLSVVVSWPCHAGIFNEQLSTSTRTLCNEMKQGPLIGGRAVSAGTRPSVVPIYFYRL